MTAPRPAEASQEPTLGASAIEPRSSAHGTHGAAGGTAEAEAATSARGRAIAAAREALASWIEPVYGDLHAITADRALWIAYDAMIGTDPQGWVRVRELEEDLTDMGGRLAKLRDLHRPYRGVGDRDTCESCSGLTGEPVLYPCPTAEVVGRSRDLSSRKPKGADHG